MASLRAARSDKPEIGDGQFRASAFVPPSRTGLLRDTCACGPARLVAIHRMPPTLCFAQPIEVQKSPTLMLRSGALRMEFRL